MVKKIAIFGSCVSRDNFNSKFNPDYKDYFECVLHQHQTSILSIMSDPIPLFDVDNISGLNNFNKWHLKTEFNKEFLKKIIEQQPDYLIIDFYADVYEGVIELDNKNYITNNSRFSQLPFYKDKVKNKKMNIVDDTEEYYGIWKRKIDEFFNFINTNLPKCKVILNSSRFRDELDNGASLTEIRGKQGIRTIDVEELNNHWEKLDNYVVKNYKVKILDLTSDVYQLSTNHPWGSFYVHYTKNYYHDFLKKLVKLSFIDLEEELKQAKEKHRVLEKKIRFFENESFIHNIKRHLLRNTYIKKANDYLKRKTQ